MVGPLFFLVTFLLGLIVITYLLVISYKTGKTSRIYEANSALERCGFGLILNLVFWGILFLLLGFLSNTPI